MIYRQELSIYQELENLRKNAQERIEKGIIPSFESGWGYWVKKGDPYVWIKNNCAKFVNYPQILWLGNGYELAYCSESELKARINGEIIVNPDPYLTINPFDGEALDHVLIEYKEQKSKIIDFGSKERLEIQKRFRELQNSNSTYQVRKRLRSDSI